MICWRRADEGSKEPASRPRQKSPFPARPRCAVLRHMVRSRDRRRHVAAPYIETPPTPNTPIVHPYAPVRPQSCQSQTVFKNCTMFTRLPFISTIQGCSSMRQGVARRSACFSRLHVQSQHINPNVKESKESTYQHSIKYLKFSLHLMPSAGSSLSLGIGWRTI
jgi:hypothetical protein